jgi:hypothetical protein
VLGNGIFGLDVGVFVEPTTVSDLTRPEYD